MKGFSGACFVLIFLLGSARTDFGQRVEIGPYVIAPSPLLDELKTIRSANPKIGTEEFVETANSLLARQGLNFVFGLDPATCQRIREAKKVRKEPAAPLNLRAGLKSVEGEAANLLLPEARFEPGECLPCFVLLPVLGVQADEFVMIVRGQNIKFHRPAVFTLHEAALVDEENPELVRTTWRIPFRAAPLSVSDDGSILYLALAEPELKDLALMVFAEGVFQFCARSEIDAAKKPVPLEDFPQETAAGLAFLKFETGQTRQLVRFPADCLN